jgi:hypothetical protein
MTTTYLTFTGFGTQMSAANLLFTYLLLIYLFYLEGSNAPKEGELVEAGYYIVVDVYYYLVPVNKCECIASRSCLNKQTQ